MRWLRKSFDVGLPVLGMAIVFAAALGLQDVQMRIVLILIGLLLIEVGVWKLANPLYPNERRFNDLRTEADRFMHLVRAINETAVQARESASAEDWARYEAVLSRMHRSVDRMGELAGREDGEPLEEDEHEPFRAGAGL